MDRVELDTGGLLASFLLPAGVFALLLASYPIPEPRPLILPPVSAHCQATLLAPDCPAYYPDMAPAGFEPWEQTCSPQDVSWTTSLQVLPAADSPSDCVFGLVVVDSLENVLQLSARSTVYADSARPSEQLRCTRADGALHCLLRGAPWRRYWIAAVVEETAPLQLAAPSIRLSFFRKKGLNFRKWEGVRFAGLLLLGGALTGPVLVLRPGGRWRGRSVRWWVDTGVLGVLGGFITGLLYALRPADFGGFDQARQLPEVLALMMTFGAVGGGTAVMLAELRPRLLIAPRATLFLAWLGAVLLAAALGVFLYGVAAGYGMAQLAGGLNYKERYYIYFGVATLLPLVLYRDPALRQRLLSGWGPVPPPQSGWLRDLCVSSLGGLVATMIAIALGVYFDAPEPARSPLVGFYKPLSGVGLWLIMQPLLVLLTLAVNQSREAPIWVQRLEGLLGQWAQGAPARRSALAQDIVALLRTHEPEIPAGLAHLGYSARQLRRLREHYTDADAAPDLELLAALCALPEAEVEALLARCVAAMAAAPQREKRYQTPLLLVDSLATPPCLVPAALELSCAPDPNVLSGYALEIVQDGHPLPQGVALASGIGTVLEAVLKRELAAEQAGQRWTISLQVGAAAGSIQGESYQLSLALLACALAREEKPLTAAWAASGALNALTWRVEPVTWLSVKADALAHTSLLLAPTESVLESHADLLELWEGALMIVHVDDSASLNALRGLRRRLEAHLRSGGRAVIGVSTFQQAAMILYGGL